MRITLQQRGGILGLDRHVQVDDGNVHVEDAADTERSFELSSKQWADLQDLAAKVATLLDMIVQRPDNALSDAMGVELSIDHDDGGQAVRFASGDYAPPEVWNLVAVMGDL